MYKLMRFARNFSGARQYNRGDTIVEVLISIAIVSAVITGAYAIANRSLHQGISASEHTEALSLATGQLESLKFRQQKSNTTDFSNYFENTAVFPNFCLDTKVTGTSDPNWLPTSTQNGNNPNTLIVNGLPGGNYVAKCTSPAPPAAPKYYININVTKPLVSTLPLYHITVQWYPAGGGPNETTQLYYRF